MYHYFIRTMSIMGLALLAILVLRTGVLQQKVLYILGAELTAVEAAERAYSIGTEYYKHNQYVKVSQDNNRVIFKLVGTHVTNPAAHLASIAATQGAITNNEWIPPWKEISVKKDTLVFTY